MRKFILQSDYALGDIVLLTAAVRDLHRAYPGQFQTDIRSGFPDLWRHNPWVTPLNPYEPDVTTLRCEMRLVQRSDDCGCHCLHGFIEHLNQYLGTQVTLSEFRGDIHLSRRETREPPLPHSGLGKEVPFWLISAGGRFDNTIKWWDAGRYQEVVNHFRGRIQFAQVGRTEDHHPRLEGVIDLRGRTSVRDLVRLVHHAGGILCGVTGLMHLAAAVDTRDGLRGSRPCVVVAGGRESPAWEAYPGHQFIHTVGALPCCARGGCWRSRTVRLEDGAPQDAPEHLCVDARHGLPRCMEMITSHDVIRRIESYLEGGRSWALTRRQARAAALEAKKAAQGGGVERSPLTILNAAAAAREAIEALPDYAGGYSGRGIVICAGGVRLFTGAWVCINMLRHWGCRLPIQLWHLGEQEIDATMRSLVAPLGVECVDAFAGRSRRASIGLHGWSLKPYAILNSPFREVLLLDADNVPVRNPEYLFQARPYRKHGAVFWPDYRRLGRDRSAWRAFGVSYRDEPEIESGQILVDKRMCWAPLNLAMWYNMHSDFYYRHVHGDKETFHMAFRKLDRPYAMPRTPIHSLPRTMCQHDFQGQRIFQHRNMDKWTLVSRNAKIAGFWHEDRCRQFLDELAAKWDARKSSLMEQQRAFSRSILARTQRTEKRRMGKPAVEDDERNRGALPGLKSLRGEPAARHARVEQLSAAGCVRLGRMRISACMTSCAARDEVRRQTLASLRRSDWSRRPVALVMDQERFPSKVESIAHTAWRALRQALGTPADYVLYLEDDLRINQHLAHNLASWPPLQQGKVAMATLYNPGMRELAWDVAGHAIYVDPATYFGAQAVLLSRPVVEQCLERWFEGPTEVDMKWRDLAVKLGAPILAHSPSLAQHRGCRSVWGGPPHRASDFVATWRSPAPIELEPAGGGQSPASGR